MLPFHLFQLRRAKYLLLLSPLLPACHTTPAPPYQLRKDYEYRLALRTAGDQYLLRPWRFSQFHAPLAPGAPPMFAYCIRAKGTWDNPLPPDTIEVAVAASQADSLLLLTQRFFLTLRPSDTDTIPPDGQEHFQLHDVGGTLQVAWNGQRLSGEVIALHNSSVSRQSQAFGQVYTFFKHLFGHPSS